MLNGLASFFKLLLKLVIALKRKLLGMKEQIFDFLGQPEDSVVMTFSGGEGKDLFLGSPFFGYPTKDGVVPPYSKKLILDLNLLGDLRSKSNRNNLLRLFAWAGCNGVEITPLVALSEQQRSHADPKFAYDDYLRVMEEEFGYSLSSGEAEKNYNVIRSASSNITANTKLQRDYLLIMKKFYRSKAGFRKSVKGFADFVLAEDLPVFTIGLYLGCMYLHVKHNPGMYSAKLVSKIRSDMDVSGNHESRLMNVASDLALLQSTAEIFYNRLTDEYSYSFIASGDVTIHHALSELCWAQMKVNGAGNFGSLAFRPGSVAGKAIAEVLEEYARAFSQRENSAEAQAIRKENLRRVADDLYSTLTI